MKGSLFAALRDRVGLAIARIEKQASQLLARLDVLASFAGLRWRSATSNPRWTAASVSR